LNVSVPATIHTGGKVLLPTHHGKDIQKLPYNFDDSFVMKGLFLKAKCLMLNA